MNVTNEKRSCASRKNATTTKKQPEQRRRADEAVGATVCPVRQPYLPAQRDLVGGMLPFEPDPGGVLCLGLLPVHRAEPGTCEQSRASRDSRWSSYRANAQGEACSGLRPHDCYRALGRNGGGRQAAYRELYRYQLDPGLVDKIREATNGNYALGSPRFQDQVARALGRRVVRGRSGRPKKQADTATDDLV